jgi:hypothetical protein
MTDEPDDIAETIADVISGQIADDDAPELAQLAPKRNSYARSRQAFGFRLVTAQGSRCARGRDKGGRVRVDCGWGSSRQGSTAPLRGSST